MLILELAIPPLNLVLETATETSENNDTNQDEKAVDDYVDLK